MTQFARPALVATARRWTLWLALAIAAAQSLAAWHVYSHRPEVRTERAAKAGHVGTDTCVLCLAAAGIGGAPGPAPTWQAAPMASSGPPALPAVAPPPGAVARPYAIRAPPPLAS